MKKYRVTFSFLFSLLFYNNVYCQTITFLGYTSDQMIPVDTVTFGFANNATIGIDDGLGEIDITSSPIDSFDLRVVQRTAEDFECLFNENAEPVYFSSSFESKINLRPIVPDSNGDNSLYFEVINYSNNFDGGYDIILTNYVTDPLIPIEQYFLGFKASFICNSTNNINLDNNLFDGVPITLANIVVLPKPPNSNDDWYTHFYFKLERDITTNTTESPLVSYKIYPNPADEFIHLEGYDPESTAYELYNIQGQLVKQGDLSTTQTKIMTANLSAGLYVVNILSSNGQSTIRNLISIY